MSDVDQFCKIFLDSDISKDQLFESLRKLLNGSVEFSTITNPKLELDFERNSSFDPHERYSNFLYFRYLLEIEPVQGVGPVIYQAEINKILTCLWSRKIPAVAACGFESVLINKGNKMFFK